MIEDLVDEIAKQLGIDKDKETLVIVTCSTPLIQDFNSR